MMSKRFLVLAIVLGLGWMVSAPASAQELARGRTARDNNAAAGARAPGAMVSAGIARAQQAIRDGRAVHPITETVDTSDDDGSDGGDGAVSSGLTLEEQIAANILSFIFDRILERLGLPPLFTNRGADDADATADGEAADDGAADGAAEEPDPPTTGDDSTADPTGAADDDDTGGRRPGRGGRG